jgi:hypothetical protein
VDKTTNTPSPLYLTAYTWLILRHRIALGIHLFFFSFFNFRFSFGLCCAFFCFSLLPLSLLPLSPMSVSPCLKLTYAVHGGSLFVLISGQSHTPTIEYNSGVCEGQGKTPAITGVNIYGGVDDTRSAGFGSLRTPTCPPPLPDPLDVLLVRPFLTIF